MSNHNFTVRISEESRESLRVISSIFNLTMSEIADKAIEKYKRKIFLEKANEAYAHLKDNSKSWKEVLKERKKWDKTLSDGLIGID